MTAKFIQDGRTIDYTPSADVSAGDVVVQGALVGVAPRDISANSLGALQIDGVIEFPKTASLAVSVGDLCYWDATNGKANKTSSGNTLLGKCVKASSTTDTTVQVKLDM